METLDVVKYVDPCLGACYVAAEIDIFIRNDVVFSTLSGEDHRSFNPSTATAPSFLLSTCVRELTFLLEPEK